MNTNGTIMLLSIMCTLSVSSHASHGAVGINWADCVTQANTVTVWVTGVPLGKKASVCIFQGDTCVQRGSTLSQPAGAGGIVGVKVTGNGFAVGDKVRVSAPGAGSICGVINRMTGRAGGGGDPITEGACGDTCDTCSVPTVSEWGLIVVTLLAMTLGTIMLARRRENRVAETG